MIRDTPIEEDAQGRINLDDIWAIAGVKETCRPKHWQSRPPVRRLIIALEKKVRKSDLKENIPYVSVIMRNAGGTVPEPSLIPFWPWPMPSL
jgi:hypothetical protein